MDSIEVIRSMTLIHCARGPKICKKCQNLAEKGKQPCLVRIYFKGGNIARPMTYVLKKGKKILCEYDVLKVFDSVNEAKRYGIKNKIDVQIL